MPPKFGSLQGLKDGEGGGDKPDDDKDQKWFVGGMGQGGGGSGQNVIDPAKLMENARAQGAVSHSDHEAGRSSAFVGAGYSMAGGPAPVVQGKDEKQVGHTITFYTNGFTVDDGPLRDIRDPANAPFMNDLNQGRTPAEFAGEVDPYVSIINKAEEYKASAAAAAPQAFVGQGQSLGGPSAAAAGPVQAATASFSVDEGAPVTTIQIRLHDGSRIQQRFNHSHTVGDIYAFVATATPNAQFDLLNSFPRKKLEDMAQGIADAGLQSASLTQALK